MTRNKRVIRDECSLYKTRLQAGKYSRGWPTLYGTFCPSRLANRIVILSEAKNPYSLQTNGKLSTLDFPQHRHLETSPCHVSQPLIQLDGPIVGGSRMQEWNFSAIEDALRHLHRQSRRQAAPLKIRMSTNATDL